MAFEGGDKNNQVVHRRAVDYTLLWPIFFAPVIPIVGIALRPYPKHRWPIIGGISALVLLGAHNGVIGVGVNNK